MVVRKTDGEQPPKAAKKGATRKGTAAEGAVGKAPARSSGKAAPGGTPARKTASRRSAADKAPEKKATASKRTAGTAKAAKQAKAAEAESAAPAKAAKSVRSARSARSAAKPAGRTAPKTAARTAKSAKKTAPAAKKAATSKKATAAKKTGAREVAAKKTVAGTAAPESGVPAARGAAQPGTLAVLPGEDPWTPQEVAEARSELLDEIDRLRAEIASSEATVAGLLRDGGDSGGDEADTGSKNITREYELALAANTREMLTQAQHALHRLDEGTYGLCEVCGKPIGKARMQAFPRATLCLDDKQKQERR